MRTVASTGTGMKPELHEHEADPAMGGIACARAEKALWLATARVDKASSE